jgi:hypothetical protein
MVLYEDSRLVLEIEVRSFCRRKMHIVIQEHSVHEYPIVKTRQ